jgi:putative endonuclease
MGVATTYSVSGGTCWWPAAAVAACSIKATGDSAESLALAWLQARGLVLVQRNDRVARGPGARGGEIDLILRDHDGTLVFAEVRARRSAAQGGAAASVGAAKQRALIYAAQHDLIDAVRCPVGVPL